MTTDEFAITDACYAVWARPAVYEYPPGTTINCTVVVEVDAQGSPPGADMPLREEDVTVRVKKTDVSSPERGATLTYDGVAHTVEGFDHNNEAEWWFYVRP